MGMAAFAEQGAIVKTNIPTMIGLGRLVDMVIHDAQGQRQRVTPSSELWLAWRSDTRDLVILRPGYGNGAAAKRSASQHHRTFHGAAPTQVRTMEWPAPNGKTQSLGLIESVTYTATGIRSPSKGRHHWVHQFGDRGEHGHGSARMQALSAHAERFWPQLNVDAAGHPFVVRRASNRFTVRDWIIG
jgi:hypothetical protein